MVKSGMTQLPSLKNLTKLKYLALDNNRLTNFPDVSNCKVLIYLSSFNNLFQGLIPDFSNFQNLYYLDVSKNNLTGVIKNKFDNNPQLVAIDLSYNQFFGDLPDFASTLNIVEMNLQFNKFSGSAACSWNPLTKVKRAVLQSNMLQSPNCLSVGIPNVEYLDVSSNKITFKGTMTDFFVLTMPKKLSFLNISTNQLDVDFVSALNICSYIPSLLTLIMSGNKINSLPGDMFSSSICGNFPPYTWLDFSNCNISGTIPDWTLSPVVNKLYLDNNPNLKNNRLPTFAIPSPNFVLQGSTLACPSVISVPPLIVDIRMDASYVNFGLCQCQRGYYGKSPDCKDVPYFTNVDKNISGFSDRVFDSQERLSRGIITSWVFTDFINIQAVREIQLQLFLNKLKFNQFEDVLELYEGDQSLSGNKLLSIRGDQVLSSTTVSILNTIATLRLISLQSTKGYLFNASFRISYGCPTGFETFNLKCYKVFEFDNSIQSLVFAISALTFVVLTLVFILVYKKRNTLVIKSSSAPFCLSMIGFLMILALSSVFYAISPKNNEWLCHIRPWVTCLSLVGVLSALLVKADRIRKIFTSTDLVVQAISNSQLASIMALLLVFQSALLVAFSSSKLGVAEQSLGSGKTTFELVPTCVNAVLSNSAYSAWFSAQVAFISLLLLVGCGEAWSVRKVPTAFNEGPHIASCLMALFVLLIILLPINFMVEDNPNALVLIRGIGQVLVTLVLTFFLFGPKIFYILEGRENDKSLSSMGSKSSSSSSNSSVSK